MEDHRTPRREGRRDAERGHAVWPLWARLLQLLVGLVLYGISSALLVRSDLGLDPWGVLHQGLARQSDIAIGTWSILVGAVVLLLWIPLRLRPGVGTVSNVVVIGVCINAVLEVLPIPGHLGVQWAYLVGGIILCGIATGAYIGAALGPGPRDGLMVGLASRGHSIRLVRTLIEMVVLVSGFALGGTVGVGTVLFALSIGPLAHLTIPAFAHGPHGAPSRRGIRHRPRPSDRAEMACASG